MSFYNRSIPQQQSRNAKKGRNGNGSQTPAYAIDFNVESSGQRMANTKRRIKWYVLPSVCAPEMYTKDSLVVCVC